MKVIKHIPAYLLGLVFVVFGANFWLHFIPMQTMLGDAGTFAGLLFTTGYLAVVKVFEIVFGAMLFIPKTRALAYILIAPISVGILMFEIFMVKGAGIGVALVSINAVGIFLNKEKYLPILK